MLRFGFIGLGARGLTHVRAVAELCRGRAQIAAICGKNTGRIREALEFAPNAKVFHAERDLIAEPLDAVFVAVPNFLHVPLALESLRAGKHVFLEKPCGINAAECRQLLAAARQSPKVVMIGHELRYSPFFKKVKALVAAGEVGEPKMVWCRELRGPLQKKSNNWIEDNKLSGGILLDKNCHHFDLMNWWVDSRPIHVAAFGGNAVNHPPGGVSNANDHATVSFEYASGVRGTLQLCLFALDFPKEDLEFGVIGTEGLLQTKISEGKILSIKRGMAAKEPKNYTVVAKPGIGWGGHAGTNEIHQEFVSCILENRRPPTTPEACMDGTLLGIAAEESIREGRTVEVPNLK